MKSTSKNTMESMNVSIAEGKKAFSRLVQEASEKRKEVVITKRGKPVAVLLSFDEYQKAKKFAGYLKVMAVRDLFAGKGIRASDVFSESKAQLEKRP
jgi:prevent-host-death family protein